MRNQGNSRFVLPIATALFAVSACGGGRSKEPAATDYQPVPPTASTTPVDTPATTHHSKLAGALVGAAAGHMLGGHAVAGAAAGALIQHERNKHGK
jgi:hypothetical protein